MSNNSLCGKKKCKRKKKQNNSSFSGVPDSGVSDFNSSSWTDEEVSALEKGVGRYGSDWKQIMSDPDLAPALRGRSHFSLKSKWGRIMKRGSLGGCESPNSNCDQEGSVRSRSNSPAAESASSSVIKSMEEVSFGDSLNNNDMRKTGSNFTAASRVPVARSLANREVAAIHMSKGVAFYEIGEYLKAVAEFSTAMVFDSQNPECFVHRALALANQTDLSSAWMDCNMGSSVNGPHAELLVIKGLICGLQGNMPLAMEEIIGALTIAPTLLVGRLTRAITLLKQVEICEALGVVEEKCHSLVYEAVEDLRYSGGHPFTVNTVTKASTRFSTIIWKYLGSGSEAPNRSPNSHLAFHRPRVAGSDFLHFLAKFDTSRIQAEENTFLREKFLQCRLPKVGMFLDMIEAYISSNFHLRTDSGVQSRNIQLEMSRSPSPISPKYDYPPVSICLDAEVVHLQDSKSPGLDHDDDFLLKEHVTSEFEVLENLLPPTTLDSSVASSDVDQHQGTNFFSSESCYFDDNLADMMHHGYAIEQQPPMQSSRNLSLPPLNPGETSEGFPMNFSQLWR
jgi:hypothetical protein